MDRYLHPRDHLPAGGAEAHHALGQMPPPSAAAHEIFSYQAYMDRSSSPDSSNGARGAGSAFSPATTSRGAGRPAAPPQGGALDSTALLGDYLIDRADIQERVSAALGRRDEDGALAVETRILYTAPLGLASNVDRGIKEGCEVSRLRSRMEKMVREARKKLGAWAGDSGGVRAHKDRPSGAGARTTVKYTLVRDASDILLMLIHELEYNDVGQCLTDMVKRHMEELMEELEHSSRLFGDDAGGNAVPGEDKEAGESSNKRQRTSSGGRAGRLLECSNSKPSSNRSRKPLSSDSTTANTAASSSSSSSRSGRLRAQGGSSAADQTRASSNEDPPTVKRGRGRPRKDQGSPSYSPCSSSAPPREGPLAEPIPSSSSARRPPKRSLEPNAAPSDDASSERVQSPNGAGSGGVGGAGARVVAPDSEGPAEAPKKKRLEDMSEEEMDEEMKRLEKMEKLQNKRLKIQENSERLGDQWG